MHKFIDFTFERYIMSINHTFLATTENSNKPETIQKKGQSYETQSVYRRAGRNNRPAAPP